MTALHADELGASDNLGAASPSTHPSTPITHSPRVQKVSALSDFAPVNLKVKRYYHLLPSLSSLSDWYVDAEKERNRQIAGKIGHSFS